MSDEPTEDDAVPEPDNEVISTLRAQAKEGKQARAEAEAAKRELAFVRAGIDPDDPRQKYFVEGYKGDLTSDAIKSEATAAGFLGQVDTSEPQGMTEAERQAFAATSQAAAAGNPPPVERDIYADFRNQNPRGGESAEQFGIRLAQAIANEGGEVRYDGPFREFPGDTGIIPRPGTPSPRRI